MNSDSPRWLVIILLCLFLTLPLFFINKKIDNDMSDLRFSNTRLSSKVRVQRSMLVNPYWEPSNRTGWADNREEFCRELLGSIDG